MAQRLPHLERLDVGSHHEFGTPTKRINDGDDLNFFLSSTAYRDLMLWLLQLNRSMFSTEDSDGKTTASTLIVLPMPSESLQCVGKILDAFSQLITQAPPSTGPRRFGNVAFRDWFKLAEEEADGLLQAHLNDVLSRWTARDADESAAARGELRAYLLGSFGSAQRLDYGTGHELSFLAFLGGLWKLGAFEAGEERAIVVGLIQPYLVLVRKLIITYTLEPAGSHGVWGLDDHSFIPYIFGSAQLGPALDQSDPHAQVPTEGSLHTAPPPASVTKRDIVADYKDSNMYFSAIQFIYDVKRGPFWEHSPVLFDISGIKDGWGKINKGMLKMYTAETLEKFPVVQHFPFGGLFRWERDANAVRQVSSVHAQQQPAAAVGRGTAAPWAKSAGSATMGMQQMQASTGMPSTRAPWASRGGKGVGRSQAPSAGGMAPTGAPWAATPRPAPPSGMPPTAAPWAKRS